MKIYVLGQSIYIGFTVLELSKLHMYQFHYNIVKRLLKNKKIKLLFLQEFLNFW